MNLRSTKTFVKEEEDEAVTLAEDSQTSTCYHTIYNLQDEMDRQMYTDQTGKFPVTLYKGKQYVMILHETGSNAILVEGLCTQQNQWRDGGDLPISGRQAPREENRTGYAYFGQRNIAIVQKYHQSQPNEVPVGPVQRSLTERRRKGNSGLQRPLHFSLV